MPTPDRIQKILGYLFRSVEGEAPRETYAILDAARDDRIYQRIAPFDTEELCLYRGDKAVELAAVAPYLIHLRREDPFTEWLLESGWGKSWGIFFQSSAPFQELHRHFRKFLMVHDEKGTPLYFRYYDPRVLRVFLPTCKERELQILFGPIHHYYVEGEKEGQWMEFGCSGNFQLIQNAFHL
jgi:hypothetical protein